MLEIELDSEMNRVVPVNVRARLTGIEAEKRKFL